MESIKYEDKIIFFKVFSPLYSSTFVFSFIENCFLLVNSSIETNQTMASLQSMSDTNGILLYYKYVPLSDALVVGKKKRQPPCSEKQRIVADFYQDNCTSLNLKGRVRVGEDGVNVCIGGKMAGLHVHMQTMKDHPILQGSDIDFKLSVSNGAQNESCLRESGMDKLAIFIKKELCTLGVQFAEKNPAGGTHLSPAEFHNALGDSAQDTVLIDCRNVYESNIGHFEGSSSDCELLLPNTRQFSDFPRWVDDNAGRLEGRRIMMYCTGGVRCERASSLIMQRGKGFGEVYQLRGGIQRYLEAYTDGGRFKGRNFVFDERVTMGAEDVEVGGSDKEKPLGVVGKCLVCSRSHSDYSRRARCCRCRLLILVCDNCDDTSVLCGLCDEKDKLGQLLPPEKEDKAVLMESAVRVRVLYVLSTPAVPPLPVTGTTPLDAELERRAKLAKQANRATGRQVKDLKIQMRWRGVESGVLNVPVGTVEGADAEEESFLRGCALVDAELERASDRGEPYAGLWGLFGGGVRFVDRYMARGSTNVLSGLGFVICSEETSADSGGQLEGVCGSFSSSDEECVGGSGTIPLLRVCAPRVCEEEKGGRTDASPTGPQVQAYLQFMQRVTRNFDN